MITKAEILATGIDPTPANYEAIAAALSVGRTTVVSKQIGIGTVLAALAPNGGAFLDTIESLATVDPNIKWGMKLLERGELDIGMTATRGLLSGIATAVPAIADGIAAILELAVQPDVVTGLDVSRVVEGAV